MPGRPTDRAEQVEQSWSARAEHRRSRASPPTRRDRTERKRTDLAEQASPEGRAGPPDRTEQVEEAEPGQATNRAGTRPNTGGAGWPSRPGRPAGPSRPTGPPGRAGPVGPARPGVPAGWAHPASQLGQPGGAGQGCSGAVVQSRWVDEPCSRAAVARGRRPRPAERSGSADRRRITPRDGTRSGAPTARDGAAPPRAGSFEAARHGVLPMRDGRHKCKRVFRHITPAQRPYPARYTSWHPTPGCPPRPITIRTTTHLRA